MSTAVLRRPKASDGNDSQIIESLVSGYTQLGSQDLLGKTLEFLKENIKPGVCLICIEDVANNEAIWSCDKCYCILHLNCIQRWAKDSIANVKEAAARKGFNLPIVWCCPKCRGENKETSYPTKYKCFCGKVTNPEYNGWSAPHTCGETCEKLLQPECGHSCVLLCHAGACPPCPKQVNVACHCGNSEPRPLRCYAKFWSCGKTCGRRLECGQHECPSSCHPGDCPPCAASISKTCQCAAPQKITLKCADLLAAGGSIVTCGKQCRKGLDCGIHKCDQTCHIMDCEPCRQTCPCGQSSMACNGERAKVAGKPCNSTCGKELDCGQHFCEQKCHNGACGTCLELVLKKCRCKSREEEVSCSKDYSCATKCKKIRDCGVHPCNKKCCSGDCPPCDKVCGKTLSCKNHKCESICHRGPCYPCPLSAAVKCYCGSQVKYVPCGSEKRCAPPPCENECQKKSKCDHPKIQTHKCHHGECPRCTVVCGKKLGCGHQCPNSCHSLKPNPKPCFKCVKLVASKCAVHPDVNVECWKQDSACEEVCGKQLQCKEHACQKRCHKKISENCGMCLEPCRKPRPDGCVHGCTLGCHEGPCEECSLVAKVSCHCGTETLLVNCSKQNSLSEKEQSCKNQCTQKLTCGHRCLSLCHSGPCLETEKCRRKVKVTCECKARKQEVECFLLEGSKTIECSPTTCTSMSPKVQQTSKSKKKSKRTKQNSESHASDAVSSENEVVADKGETSDTRKGFESPNISSNVIVVSGVIAIGAVAFLTLWTSG